VLALALAAAGCGNSDHRLGGVTCGGGAELVMIDDMEDENKAAIPIASGRAGNWYAYNDKSPSGVQMPGALIDVFTMVELEPQRGTSAWAAHTSGSGFSEWGAGIACDLNLKSEYDASRHSGIAFWIRSRNPVRVQVPDRNTSPRGGNCDETLLNDCNDDFGANLPPSQDWREVRLHWSELRQAGFGRRRWPSIDASAIYAIKFQTGPDTDFDFLIDDVAFLCTDPAAKP
jgi:hypothetical protein